MEDASLKKITVVLAGRKFPVKVSDQEESAVRNIEKELNNQIQRFQQQYPDSEQLDIILMTLLSQSFNFHKKNGNAIDKDALSEHLTSLEQVLSKASD